MRAALVVVVEREVLLQFLEVPLHGPQVDVEAQFSQLVSKFAGRCLVVVGQQFQQLEQARQRLVLGLGGHGAPREGSGRARRQGGQQDTVSKTPRLVNSAD